MPQSKDISASQIRAIFPRNLQKLIGTNRTLRQVADGIGIPRQQLGRYVSGISHPSLENLTKICSYLEVDARILTEELEKPSNFLKPEGKASFAKTFDVPERYFDPSNLRLAEGIYRMWKISFGDKRLANVSLVSVKRDVDSIKVSGLDPAPFRPAMLGGSIRPARERRFYGVAMQVRNSVVIITRMSTKISITCKTLHPDAGYLLPSGSHYGLCSATIPGSPSTYDDIVPLVYEAISPDTGSILSAARLCGAIPVNDLPSPIIEAFKKGLRPYVNE